MVIALMGLLINEVLPIAGSIVIVAVDQVL